MKLCCAILCSFLWTRVRKGQLPICQNGVHGMMEIIKPTDHSEDIIGQGKLAVLGNSFQLTVYIMYWIY